MFAFMRPFPLLLVFMQQHAHHIIAACLPAVHVIILNYFTCKSSS
jgi:hypothetical protein